jgi:hypothetical protein
MKQRYQNRIELLQGTLDLLILQTLRWGAQHGYGIALAIRANPSARVFALRFFQTSPRGSALTLRYHFASTRLRRGLSPPSYRTSSAHIEKGGHTRGRPFPCYVRT